MPDDAASMLDAKDLYAAHAWYNRRMNEAVYTAAARLSDEQRRHDMGAFFGSIHLTLTHILIADRFWLARFGCDRATREFLDANGKPLRVTDTAQDIYPDFEVLSAQRARTDRAIETWVATLSRERLDRHFEYATTTGQKWRHPLWWSVSHFFNHQTHHRGQVTTLLKQCGIDPGVTDFVVMLREGFGQAAC
jgi:uncharacterized damage-inducible protein DinB